MKHNIFSTPVWHIEGTPQVLVDELYQGAYRFKERYPSENRSGAGGYQTPILEWELFHPQGKEYIKVAINECDNQVFKSFNIQGWWYNINSQGHSNIPHSHPRSHFAVVLYLTDSDRLLRFISPHHMRIKSVDHDAYENNWSIDAKKGDILIFPADVIHYVMPNQREEDRISISMNLQLC